ncbi:hypothetical protein JHK82_039635 [Glycine max]|nr:hypothetical protein JHK82_039635 [Glycine max]
MAIVQHLVIANRKRRPIICRIKPYLNKASKGTTKTTEVAHVQISLMDNGEKKNKEGVENEKEKNDEVMTSEKVEEKVASNQLAWASEVSSNLSKQLTQASLAHLGNEEPGGRNTQPWELKEKGSGVELLIHDRGLHPSSFLLLMLCSTH